MTITWDEFVDLMLRLRIFRFVNRWHGPVLLSSDRETLFLTPIDGGEYNYHIDIASASQDFNSAYTIKMSNVRDINIVLSPIDAIASYIQITWISNLTGSITPYCAMSDCRVILKDYDLFNGTYFITVPHNAERTTPHDTEVLPTVRKLEL